MYAKSGRFLVDDGDLFFESVGEGEAVVFLHGFGLDSRMWDPQFEVLQSTFRAIRYDFRGFGRSSLPPHNRYAHEDDLNALLSDLGSAPAHVVGLSMGGMMALRCAVAYPQSVRSLVLADSALDGHTWSDDWQTRWYGMREAAKTGQIAEAKRRWLEHPLFDSARADPRRPIEFGASASARIPALRRHRKVRRACSCAPRSSDSDRPGHGSCRDDRIYLRIGDHLEVGCRNTAKRHLRRTREAVSTDRDRCPDLAAGRVKSDIRRHDRKLATAGSAPARRGGQLSGRLPEGGRNRTGDG